ncbi:MAG: SsrA-binding protein [Candidatus Kerfeldbacteria bacterium CG_4_10_14_0_8_um_filter_42_10]|uniref:SsrA-binding protein n=2 Tax=Parcubacteria group TaxID=1794811 RepID=A0A2M7RIG1_9BACT|nr:MAG: SsrA-binding protein [Candidatus Kerfeldbacteria bacterium CG_4_10_14_0_8_um_filter_42_10]
MPSLAKNKRAFFDYEILDKWEAGLVLSGPEVKSAKAGQINLKGSFVSIVDEKPMLINCHIAAYQSAKDSQKDYDPTRTRKLLLNKKEIGSLIGKTGQKGLTLLPLAVYTKKGLVKVEIGLGRGKRKQDKRETLKKRATDREIRRALRGKTSP